MPGQSESRSRDRHGQSRDRARDRERERRREREYDREREARGRYDEDEGAVPSPGNGRKGKYRSQGEDEYESYERARGGDINDGADDEEQERRRRERRRRRREEEKSKAKESPATAPVRRRERERDREGYRRRRDLTEDEGSPTKGARERRHRDREGESEAEAEARRRRRRERQQQKELDREQELEAAAAVNVARKHKSKESTSSASHLLSADALTRMASGYEEEDLTGQWERRDRDRDRERSKNQDEGRRERRSRKRAALASAGAGALGAEIAEGRPRHKSGARVVSGAYLEEGRGSDMNVRRRGGGGPEIEEAYKYEESWEGSYDSAGGPPAWKFWNAWSKKKRTCIGAVAGILILLAIIVPVAVVESKKKASDSASSSSSSASSDGLTGNLDSITRDSIPSYAQGTYLDPFTWYETEGFNLTFTNDTVGGLYLMGLNSSWEDTARPNDNVPPLNEAFPYGSQPIRGVNIGGWLSIEPWITPSLFDTYSSSEGIIDEWTLTTKLGSAASTTIEKHYATFYTEEDFADIKEAGLDHVRIQYSYWAVKTYDGDPYVAKIAWRYLLRAIEYCRKYGLRVKLDLHGIPGSQNGWEHSGHQGSIGWLNGTNGELNANRSLEIHDQLSTFFAQDRYKNVVTMYGVVNEPLMLSLSVEKVLDWTNQTAKLVRKNGVNATIVFHDGFLNLDKWDSMLKDHPEGMYLDTHQYTTFNTGEIVLNHTAKINLICNSWYPMIEAINSTSDGWGPTICGEWSQADTDCAKYLNNVGRGTRWEGTYDTSSSTQYCPTANDDGGCSCDGANAAVSEYSDAYKKWLLYYAEAQMSVFETAMGWFYWTWRTESASQWSYLTAWKNGFLPTKAYSPSFKCGDDVPDFSSLGLPEDY